MKKRPDDKAPPDDKPNVLAKVAMKKHARRRMIVEESSPDLRHDPRRTPPPMAAVTDPGVAGAEVKMGEAQAPAQVQAPAQAQAPGSAAEDELVIVRGNYLDMIETAHAQAPTADPAEAETAFQLALAALAAADFPKAESALKKALKHDPDKADYVALGAWISAVKPDAKQGLVTMEIALERLERAIRLDPSCERAFYYRGMLRKQLDRIDAAIEDFRASARLKPRGDGERELRLLERRREAEAKEKAGGLFGRLFKK